jgi:hypothetical protein
MCGSDGCEGVCGVCDPQQSCQEGQCVCPPELPYFHNGKCVQCFDDAHCGAPPAFCAADYTCTTCPPETPHLADGQCVQCLEDSHCLSRGVGWTCDLAAHVCAAAPVGECGLCPQEQPLCVQLEEGWKCVQCMADPDCLAGEDCNLALHVCVELPEECEYCLPPYPACTQIDGLWSCVECADDSTCAEGWVCAVDLYTCVPGGSTECGTCEAAADCPPDAEGSLGNCDPGSGCCFSPMGFCDGKDLVCNVGGGSECVDSVTGQPFEPGAGGTGYCVCPSPLPADALMNCIMGLCPPDPQCFPGSVCLDLSIFIPEFPLPGPVCLDPAQFMMPL